MAPTDIDNLVQQILNSNNAAALNHTFKNAISRDVLDHSLCNLLVDGSDPLTLLDPQVNTLGCLYILSARLRSPTNAPSFNTITEFCQSFDGEQARIAPEQMSLFARGIVNLATYIHNQSWSIEPLRNILLRFPYDSTYLTSIHHLFVLQCVVTRSFIQALPIIENPIINVSMTLSPDLHYNDNLMYHYTSGIAFTALKRWAEAEDAFEMCVTSPGTVAAALQLEALKKLRLVQMISKGSISVLPKYTHLALMRLFKNTPYYALISAYPHDMKKFVDIVRKENNIFATEQNLGLINQALARAPRWTLKKLTATYVTLALPEIGKAIKIDDEERIRGLLLDMIESGDISAQISADKTVTFVDSDWVVTKGHVDEALRIAQEQAVLLGRLEEEMGKSKEYLNKAVKNKEDFSGGGSMDLEGAGSLGALLGPGSWAEESLFG